VFVGARRALPPVIANRAKREWQEVYEKVRDLYDRKDEAMHSRLSKIVKKVI
jgi:hypothetical protein